MQLQADLWIEGAYYVDFDELGQLRIVGPYNHLHFGSVGIYKDGLTIDEVYSENGQLVVVGRLRDQNFLHDPAMGHIQKVRYLVEHPGKASPTFAQVAKRHPSELAPNYIAGQETTKGFEINYRRLYQNHWYGVRLRFDPAVKVKRVERRRGFRLQSDSSDIKFTLTTDIDHLPEAHLDQVVRADPIVTDSFGAGKHQLDQLLDRTAIEITHLVRNNKTSGFDYGTVFPRDWMEAIDLGLDDLEPEAVNYMLHKAIEYVDAHGSGWHENIVGEYEFEKEQEMGALEEDLDDLIDQSSRISATLKDLVGQVKQMYVVRKMIDIEPRYLLELDNVDPAKLADSDLHRLQRAARYVLLQAESNQLITFKKLPTLLRTHKHDEYYAAGNWRDSARAFKMVHPVIAPYDVNVVFYPRALAMIRRHAQRLEVDPAPLRRLIDKWSRVEDLYRFKNKDGTSAFALALYNVKLAGDHLEYKKLEVNHLDEAYRYYYCADVPEADVKSFARRLVDPNYFYTRSGPLVVGHHDGYNSLDYHGQVIWTKQTAYVVEGLYRQLARAKQNKWHPATIRLVTRAITSTARASVKAFLELGAVPELHYDRRGTARFYNDQPEAEGPMNQVQLWSAIGARRIIRTYLATLELEAKLPAAQLRAKLKKA